MTVRREVIGDAIMLQGDCLDLLGDIGPVELVATDPPYGITSLRWDKAIDGWVERLRAASLWCFGSMGFFLNQSFPGWTFAQEIIWEKHNGSSFRRDRFRRVHEIAVQFYRGDWADVYKDPVFTADATARAVRRKGHPAHMNHIASQRYVSTDGGPRMMRSVFHVRSCQGFAEHETQKPVAVMAPLIQHSCPPGGRVLDPFRGSGTTGVACIELGRQFIGIEKDPKYFDVACRRVEQAIKQRDLLVPAGRFVPPVQLQLDPAAA